MSALLSIKNLSIRFNDAGREFTAVDAVSFDVHQNRMVAIVGESGSGKSLTALSILHLLPKAARVVGEMHFEKEPGLILPLHSLAKKDWLKIRGRKIAMIFQEPMTSLNPVFTCGFQVAEVLRQHLKLDAAAVRERVIQLFERVELPEPSAIFNRYPHEISGGQKQRVMIAMAISCNPSLLIADEPTTALDVRVQKEIIQLLKKVQSQTSMAVLLITHDLGLVADVADECHVFQKGKIVEQGNAVEVMRNPAHPYTQSLLACRPHPGLKGKPIPVAGSPVNLAFTNVAEGQPTPAMQPGNSKPLSVQQLTVSYKRKSSWFKKQPEPVKAVDNVNFDILESEIVGLVGESGCGKTTLGKAILQLITPTSGKIFLQGTDLSQLQASALRNMRKEMQVVFQDPYGSLNPRLKIIDTITEPIKVHEPGTTVTARKERAAMLLEQVLLKPDMLNRYPHQFSGGQRQRICIARALALNPSLLVFDESVSALDVSVQAQVLNLINELKNKFRFSALFISHDLSVVHYISDRILVMQKGKIVETGLPDDILFRPADPYTKLLIDAIPGKKLKA